ncbi:MAG TPA: hypothetical protein VNO30_07650 [Kofleriaceae bacterium]|nr:hypothetical protein [Kofleriaceae bacterium]
MRRTFLLVSLFLLATLSSSISEARRRPAPAPVAPPQPTFQWDSRGWTMLGEQAVSGRVDRDRVTVGRYEGRFSKLTLVVLDSDLELQDFTINFADGTKYEPRVQHYFRENARTRVLDLPPNGGLISHIDLKYKNLPGGGRARVQVWGFKVAGAPQPAPQPAPVWDSRGWTMLGEQAVSGRVDRDVINVGRYEGRFSKLTLVVLDSDLELLDFTIRFADGTKYEPRVQHYFRESARTRVLDLPPNGGLINRIDLKYKNLPGGGRARVQVWGFKFADGPGAGPGAGPGPAPGPVWDSRGWELLGEQTVGGRVDRDRITVGREMGKFSKLMVVVLDSELEMIDMEVVFRRGQSFRPAVAQYFRESTRTRAIDLPDSYRGPERTIQHIDFKYKNLPGGGRARVQVWGFQGGSVAPGGPAPAPAPIWDSKGWELLGEQTVGGRVDRDRITVGRAMGKFSKLMVVVLDSELEMIDMEVMFRRGQSFRPAVSQYFRENTRTRAIDLPDGYRGPERTIEHIDFKYKNLPGGGRARVQVWGK